MVEKVVWSKEAARERNEILAYWNERNKSNVYSMKLLDLIRNAIETIKLFPEIGIPTSRPDTRLKIVRDYFIVYKIEKERLLILSFWDARQDPNQLKNIILL
ncbi:MAG: type II toxin-antitoxin system RelE/ParE family toxin [Bacteroidetes bacterium]|nr:type II toxin-antitoxin system RelE/ParE family toxin [Bacteroidota bacterium]